MRLFIAIGRQSRTAAPELVYLGDDGSALEAAIAVSPFPLVEKFLNPRGVRKHIAGAAENAKAEEKAFAAEVAAEQAKFNAAVELKAGELVAAHEAKIGELTAEIERLKEAKKPKP